MIPVTMGEKNEENVQFLLGLFSELLFTSLVAVQYVSGLYSQMRTSIQKKFRKTPTRPSGFGVSNL